MIVSHQHKFIFVKTAKTGGTSIEAALSQLCGPDDIITPFREDAEKHRQARGPQNYRIEHPLKPSRPLWRRLLGRPERYWHKSIGFYEHIPAWRARAYLGQEIWDSYFKIAFDRNPWDRQISWYLYKTKSKRRRPSFERFMESRGAFLGNYKMYTIDGGLAVDFLGRYETLEDDLNKALQTIGIGRRLAVPRTNVTPNKDSDRDYRSYYSDATRERVAEWYAPEIEMLGYGF